MQKQSELSEIDSLKAEKAKLQKEVEQLQAERVEQHNSLKMLSASKINKQKELRGLNNTIKRARSEYEAIKGDLEEVKDYLTEGQQTRLAEIDREWNDDERGC